MRIKDKFDSLKGEGAFIPYICAGDPDFETSLETAGEIIKAGADVLELGLPFSDPIADGPTIQKASQRALEAGMNTDRYFEYTSKVHSVRDIPLVCMTYYNLVLQYGLERFTGKCVESGITGLIIPDLPVEEAGPLHSECRKKDIDLIYLVAETTTDERLDKILEKASGFIYIVSLLGTTGTREKLSETIKPLIKKLRKKTGLPLAVGFGISKPEHVHEVIAAGADAAIVGSAIIQRIEEDDVSRFVEDLKKATIR
jgi:tryptophan synthase alpha chain